MSPSAVGSFQRRARRPAGALGDRIDQIDRARVFQIAQAVFDRIDAGFGRRVRRYRISCANVFGSAETPRNHDARTIGGMSCATTRMCVVIVRRDRGAVAHLEHGGTGAIVPVSSSASVGAPFDG